MINQNLNFKNPKTRIQCESGEVICKFKIGKCIKYIGILVTIMSMILYLLCLFPVKLNSYKDIVDECEIPEVSQPCMIEIYDFEDLYDFVQLFYKQKQKYYVVTLRNNIMIPDGQGNLSIGTSEKPFWGEFRGNNFKISGIDIYGEENVTGFFNYIDSARIEGLILDGNVSSIDSIGTGGIAGRATNSEIKHCSFSGNVKANGGSVGGIAGNNHSMISECQSEAKLSGGGNGGYGWGTKDFSNFGSGGIAGNNEGTISFSDNMGTVNVDDGGIVGWNNGTVFHCNNIANGKGSGIADINTGNIFYCTNTGDMSGNSVAGIALSCTEQGHIQRCINFGTMEGRYVGGLVAVLGQDSHMGPGYIEDCISISGMRAIGRIHAGTANAIHTISPQLAQNEKKQINISTKNRDKMDVEEIYLSLLKNKKKSMKLKALFLFLTGIILWKFEYLKMFYKKVVLYSCRYRQLTNNLKKSIRNKEKIELGHIDMEGQTIPLNWDILIQEEEKVLLISSENVCCRVYHEKYQPVCWYESSLFRWLNKEFPQICFTETERKLLGEEITILDKASVEQYFPLEEMRQSKNSKYACEQGAVSKGAYGYWWLKSYDETERPSVVTADGRFSNQGIKSNMDGICIRPVVCIHLGKRDENIR